MKNRKVPHQDHMNTVCLDRFFTRQNVALYRALADKRTGAARRRKFFSCWRRSRSNSGRISRDLRITQVSFDKLSW
jgi:hypothetical protein